MDQSVPKVLFKTHWGRDKTDAILQTTFSNAISWMKMVEFRLKFHWSLFLKVQLTIFQHWFRWWFGGEQATSLIWTNDGPVQRRIYTSLGVNELKGWFTRSHIRYVGVLTRAYSKSTCGWWEHMDFNWAVNLLIWLWVNWLNFRI